MVFVGANLGRFDPFFLLRKQRRPFSLAPPAWKDPQPLDPAPIKRLPPLGGHFLISLLISKIQGGCLVGGIPYGIYHRRYGYQLTGYQLNGYTPGNLTGYQQVYPQKRWVSRVTHRQKPALQDGNLTRELKRRPDGQETRPQDAKQKKGPQCDPGRSNQ